MNSFFNQLGDLGAFGDTVDNSSNFQKLPPFLRVLLSTDGTVTNSLESYFWESIVVEPQSQSLVILDESAPAIARQAGDEVLSRQVQLRGRKSNRVYVRASSLIRLDLLSSDFQDQLQSKQLGVGELLRDCGLETYREILEIKRDETKQEMWRRYRIVMEHHPFIQITEHFPIKLYV